MTESSFQNLVKGKNVVYITVKNRDYIRVSQIERILGKSAASYKVYASEKGNPLTRALDLRRRVKEIDLAATDVVIVGFLPQLIWKDIMKVARGQMRGAGGEDKSFEKKAPYLVADFFLSLYDTVVLDRKLIRTTNPLTGILRRMDKRVLAGADLVMTDTKANAELLKDTAPMKCYADHNLSYSTNEITIYWNSPLVFTLAYMMTFFADQEA